MFDVKRNISSVKSDTIVFSFYSGANLLNTKQFIFNYILPKEYKLEQNFPNPFNPTTTIQYQVPTDGRVTLKVYDILGSEVTTLFDGIQEAGFKEINFDASSLASGIYVYRLSAGKYISTKKMILLK